jgi:HD-GYP domain-containing protein (c-di-GMP phosphodiesterase class II)
VIPIPAAAPHQVVPAVMDPATDVKKIMIVALIFLSEISVFSLDDSANTFNTVVSPILLIVLCSLLIFLLIKLIKYKKMTRQINEKLDQKTNTLTEKDNYIKELENLLDDEKNIIQHINSKNTKQKYQQIQLVSAIAASDIKKIENLMSETLPDVEKILLKSFEKGQRIKIDELSIDMNKKKVLSLEKSVLFEDYDESGKKIFFYPVKGGQQNIGAVILLLKNKTDTNEALINYLNDLAKLLSTSIIRQKYEKYTEDFQKNIILSLVNILELHDENEKGHSERVAKMAVDIGEALKLQQSEIIQLYWVAMIHDIGKIFLPYAIRSKRARMTLKEYELFQKHSIWGEHIIGTNDELDDIAKYVRHHHERWDGKGYPDRLKGLDIPLISRIITIADSYDNIQFRSVDALKIKDDTETIEQIKLNSGKVFDPELVSTLIDIKQ